ncbi:MAG TPA: FixH family protein, partial [Polyangiaceae bacterium]|nr:FixH family protein [Polyangiaceae bacterium]
MNTTFQTSARRRLVVSISLVLGLVALAVVFHGALIAWFTGKSMSGAGSPITAQVGSFSAKAALDPDPPAVKGNTLLLEVHDGSGKAVDDAMIDVGYDMPAMAAMAEMKGSAKITHEKDGRYRAEFDLPMGGTWPLAVSIRTATGSGSQTFGLTVGSKGLSLAGGSGGAMPPMPGMAGGSGTAPMAMDAAPSASAHGEVDHYTCSMHPSVKQQGPGKCPICSMDLIPVTKEQQEQGVVMIDETRRQLIGVRTAPVTFGPMRDTFRA